MSELQMAKIQDTTRLMRFMHDHWRADHILSRNRELFLYDFQEDDRLNIAIAENADGEIMGLFGFMKYNASSKPDIAGSLWKVRDDAGEPMLGLRLRRYVIQMIPHRFFAAPGAGLQTKSIYRLIGMDWIEMEQYFWSNPNMTPRRLHRLDSLSSVQRETVMPMGYRVREVAQSAALSGFPFSAFPKIGPQKDLGYIKRRFYSHPIYQYRVFLTEWENQAVGITVCRVAAHGGASALRIVEHLGEDHHLSAALSHLIGLVVEEHHEYLDFVCSGFDHDVLVGAGMRKLDFEGSETVVPNYFEPFVMSNVRTYAVADRLAGVHPRLVRADGDQDRPNFDIATTSLDVALKKTAAQS